MDFAVYEKEKERIAESGYSNSRRGAATFWWRRQTETQRRTIASGLKT